MLRRQLAGEAEPLSRNGFSSVTLIQADRRADRQHNILSDSSMGTASYANTKIHDGWTTVRITTQPSPLTMRPTVVASLWHGCQTGSMPTRCLFIDACSIEAFDSEGRMAMSNLVFPTEPYNSIKVKGGEGYRIPHRIE